MDTKKQLFTTCKRIAKEIATGKYDMRDWEIEKWNGPCAQHYLHNALDIEYTVSSKFDYLGARVCVAFGGPNIYIDTRYKIVRGSWYGEKAEVQYCYDERYSFLDVDAYCCEIYEASQ